MNTAFYTDPRKLVMDVRDLYSLPDIYYRIDKAVKDPDTSNALLGKILSEDEDLSVRLLKLSNSEFYRFPSKVNTITAAISIIGTKQLRDIVLVMSVVKMFKSIPKELMTLDDFWSHCIGCGVVARVIANINRESNVESFFVAGVLHDIGSLLIYSSMAERSADVVRYSKQNRCCLHQAEEHCLGFTHTQVGGYLLKQWGLPKRLIEAVYYHHKPKLSRAYPSFSSVIHVADVVATGMAFGNNGEYYVPDFDKSAWLKTGLNEDDFYRVLPESRQQFDDVMAVIFD